MPKIPKKHQGIFFKRTLRKESIDEHLAAAWWAKIADQILPDLCRSAPTKQDRELAATLMQWLGSPVGRCELGRLLEAWDRKGSSRKRRARATEVFAESLGVTPETVRRRMKKAAEEQPPAAPKRARKGAVR